MFRDTALTRRLGRGTATALILGLGLIAPGHALAAPGYQLDSAKPSISTAAEIPRGVAIDQASQDLYVTELTADQKSGGAGQVEQFDSSGVPTASSPFGTGGSDFFTGVAVNPVDESIYAYQVELHTPFGAFGTAKMNAFSSAGVPGTSFTPAKSVGPQLAADAAGRVYLPDTTAEAIQVFDSSGALKESISCSSCSGGAFVEPVSVALDAAGNLYAVDLSGGGRVIKFVKSGGAYVYDSLLQSGKGAAAVGVDPSDNTVFVGDVRPPYHIVAYDSSGNQIDDFGEGLFSAPALETSLTAGQIAVNATTRKVYVADSGANEVRIFDRVASIPAPTATTNSATAVGQLEATLNGAVNPRGHALTSCSFEYTTDADYLANGMANATAVPCGSLPGGSVDVTVSVHLSGLTPDTKYDFQVSATSNGGAAEGTVLNFTTLEPLPPEVTTGSASSVTQTTAMLAGTVNPKGGPISNCYFEYIGQSAFEANGFEGASSAPCSPAKPSGTTGTAVSAKISGLTSATEYRFRVVATNNSGTTKGGDQAFATLADTCATKAELCPPPEQTPPPAETLPTESVPPPSPVHRRLRCRKGFKKRRVHGKLRCVRRKGSRRRAPARAGSRA